MCYKGKYPVLCTSHLEEEMAIHLLILSGKSHRQRSLVGYSRWGRRELETTNQLSTLCKPVEILNPVCIYVKYMQCKYVLLVSGRVHACLLSLFSCARPFVTPWTIAQQAPLSMGFSRQEYWSELPFPFSMESSWSRDRTCVSYVCLHWQAGSSPLAPPGRTFLYAITFKSRLSFRQLQNWSCSE